MIATAVVTCEIKLFQNYFSLRRRPSEIILFQCSETCMKLFQNYFRSLLQFINILQHVQYCRNNFEIISATAEIILFQFQMRLHVKYTRAHHADEIPEREVTYHLTNLLI